MTKKIVIVDDDPLFVKSVALLLEKYGFESAHASDAKALAERLRAGETADLFIVDMQMPGGGGPAVVKSLRADSATATIPIVIVSGMPIHHQEAWFRGQARMRFLRKPVEPMDILGHVRDLIGT